MERERMELAWLDDGPRRFIARLVGPARSESAITRLIQGIYELEPRQARRILRQRIRATALRPTEMCWGMVRVVAKRMDCGVPHHEADSGSGLPLIELAGTLPPPGAWGESPPGLAGLAPMELARSLAAGVSLGGTRVGSDRRIAAVLVSKEGQVLGWAVNSSGANKTRHAEVNLVQSYCQKVAPTFGVGATLPLPPGSRIYTTLKSCKMCAGMIWQAAQDPLSIRVIYDEEDPGPKARFTVLNANSFERQRAAQSDDRAGLGAALIEVGPAGA